MTSSRKNIRSILEGRCIWAAALTVPDIYNRILEVGGQSENRIFHFDFWPIISDTALFIPIPETLLCFHKKVCIVKHICIILP